MIKVTVRFLGGLREEMGAASTSISLPDDATVGDLVPNLRILGLNLEPERNIIVLNGRGLAQWPPDRPVRPDDVVIVFPHIGGGQE